ncbi:bifunctional 3-(3-hydroxy-phenyl)propionate/3-hydroxycinnamic acid hydroxylase [Nocardioides piscis]|uniref:Bifunctional 3-(3-hydroxy-phenyl)propionate/3-hydroxycinnamic acid hydroxylase n=1 Tax=Nocardioides piscis TaxID=2714938 RepID=A0A6G7YDK3_9ACTN|nr:bifunctional 3-(3-hydroxy-phenyl)propionate/3-hydroxycinnamic acid hydroxylase [Nocardioides piscis]QIK74718.1 bifunctional 3-(3-hydroxy-phenyl)propionate/3-hydroxycinnamic acid hydroxylase [Nocardioides piscis]
MTEDIYDVAIVGYGPVGVTAANILGQRGLRVLVAERDANIYDRARAISTDEEVLRIWQRIGLAEHLKTDMLTDRPIDFVDEDGISFLRFTAPYRGNGHPAQLFIYQPALETALRDGASRFPNVEVFLQHEAVRFSQDDNGVDLTLLDLLADRVKRVRARYIIAADGGSSPTRGQLGISFEGRTYEDRWVVIDTKVKNEWPEVDRLRFHCNPSRPTVDCPTPLGHHRWEFPVLAGDDEQQLVSQEHIWQLLDDQGIGREHVEILRAVIYSHHVRFAARWRVGRIFLAGDAAHVMPPWIGQGMASGVRDVDNLCWKLADVLSGRLPESVLDTYEIERKPHVRAVTKKAVLAGRLITERRTWLARTRNVAFGLADRVDPVRRAIGNACWVPPTAYADGFLAQAVTRRRLGASTLIGRLLPQPHVTDERGNRILLDDATGHDWRVLALPQAYHDASWEVAGTAHVVVLPAGSAPMPGAVVDDDDVLVPWMRQRSITAIAVRPDGIIFAAAQQGSLGQSPLGVAEQSYAEPQR